MKLYQFVLSPFAIKVRAALELKGMAVELVDITLESYPALLRANPRAKAPVLEDGDTIVPDSTAIIAYLEARVPEPRLVPEDATRRARTLLLEDWADESLYWFGQYFQIHPDANAARIRELYVGQYPQHIAVQVASQISDTAREQTHQQGIGRKPVEEVCRDLARHAETLATWLAGEPYFGGTAPDLADCALYGQSRALVRTEQGATLVSPEPLRAWFARMHRYDLAGLAGEPYNVPPLA